MHSGLVMIEPSIYAILKFHEITPLCIPGHIYMFSSPPQKFTHPHHFVPPDLDSLPLPLQKILVGTNGVPTPSVNITVPTRFKCMIYHAKLWQDLLQETWQDYAIYLGNFLSYIILSKLCTKHGKIQAKICCQEFARSLRSARIRQDTLLELKKKNRTLYVGIYSCCTYLFN